MVTSREPLSFQAERVIRLAGLPVPAASTNADQFSSVQLFAERAERSSGAFELNEVDLPAVIEICQLVGGSPLGLELAAAGIRQKTATEIVATLRSNLDALATTLRDVPLRHRSMRAVFESSWQLLTLAERNALARLAVFLGGFTAEAALAVTEATESILSALVDKSLVRVESGRYSIHELLRQFATAHLDQPALDANRRRHSHYYLELAGSQRSALNGPQPSVARSLLQTDLDNLREAWRAAVTHHWWSHIANGWRGLADFYSLSGLYHEALLTYQTAIDQLTSVQTGPALETADYLLTALLVSLTRFYGLLFRLAEANEAGRQAVRAAQAAGAIELEALAKCYWGMSCYRQSNFAEAAPLIEEGLRLARLSQSSEVEAMALRAMGYLADIQGRYAEARAIQSQALELYQQADNAQGQCLALVSLGNIAWSQGDLAAAQHYHAETLRLARLIGNRNDECDALHNVGNDANSLGDYEAARVYFEQSIEVGQQIGLPPASWSITVANLGLVYHHLGQNEQAARVAQQALKILQTVIQRSDEALALKVLGHALTDLGDLAGAGDAYSQAAAIQRELGQPNLALENLAGLARVELKRNDVNGALRLVREILTHLETGNVEGAD
jgi:tetratricopeptide (TPR) repeat protein